MKKIKRLRKKIFSLRSYYFFTINTGLFNNPPAPDAFSTDYTFHDCDCKDVGFLTPHIPYEYLTLWTNVLETHQDYKIFYLLNHKNQLVYYFFFIYGKPVYIKEINLPIHLTANEAYLSAERTFPAFQNKGISQLAKKYLLHLLHSKGVKHIYVITESKKVVPSHIYLKMGAHVLKHIFSIRLLTKNFLINRLSLKDLELTRNSNI